MARRIPTLSFKARLIEALDRMAVLLELDDANSFKVNAYAKAARAVADATVDVEKVIADGALTSISGVGKGIAEKIEEFHRAGSIAEMVELQAKYPPGVVEMTTIAGFGPKKARAVFENLGATSIVELERACREGKVAELKGFGKKTEEKILEGIALLRRHTGRFRIDTAWEAAQPILAVLRAHPAVERAEVAGSLRRWRETAKDLDFVVATRDPQAVMQFFVDMDCVDTATGQGETKSSVLLDCGMGADLRCVTPEQFPFTLQHFTGSKEHNTRLRARAKERGMRSSEYGLFPEGSETSLDAKTEEDIYRHLGLAYVEPEMREDMGEIEAAEAGALPRLVERADFRGLMHMHTTYSDGKPCLDEYAKWAAANGIEWMGIADHSKTASYAGGLQPDRVRKQWAEIARINKERAHDGVRLLRGIESDILADGSLDYDDDILREFEFVVASVHSHFTLTEEEQTARMLKAIEHPCATILGHMTGRLLLRREGYAVNQKTLIDRAAQCGTVVEINANPARLDLDWRLVHYALDRGCLISVGPDAHAIRGLDDVRYGLGIARKGWATKDRVVNCLGADEFLELARRKRER